MTLYFLIGVAIATAFVLATAGVYKHNTQANFWASIRRVLGYLMDGIIEAVVWAPSSIRKGLKNRRLRRLEAKFDKAKFVYATSHSLNSSINQVTVQRVIVVQHGRKLNLQRKQHVRRVNVARLQRIMYSDSWLVLPAAANDSRLVRNANGDVVFAYDEAFQVAQAFAAGQLGSPNTSYSSTAFHGTFWKSWPSLSNAGTSLRTFALCGRKNREPLAKFEIVAGDLLFFFRATPLGHDQVWSSDEVLADADGLTSALRRVMRQAYVDLTAGTDTAKHK